MTKLETDRRPTFKYLGGWRCLDFVDSRNWDSREAKYERFMIYTDFVWWNHDVGVFTEEVTQPLLQEAKRRPAEAAAMFDQCMALRDTIYQVFEPIANGTPLEQVDLSKLNELIARILTQSQLVATANNFKWRWVGAPNALERVMWFPLWSTVELLTSSKLKRVKCCSGRSCGWLFLDTSRNGSRRWCEMKHCGNQAKARRHYQRKKVRNRA